MKSYRALCVCLLLIAQAAISAEPGWIERGGKPLVEDTSRRSVAGFGGWLVVTPDPDWEAKWNTPAETTPQFNTAENVRIGETLTILIFYGNPRPDAQGDIDIRCDFRVTRPDGTRSVDAKSLDCASGKLDGPPNHLRLSSQLLMFVGEPNDPRGKWTVDVTLYDKHAKLALPLSTSFELL